MAGPIQGTTTKVTVSTGVSLTLNGVVAGSLLVFTVSYIDTAQASSAAPANATDTGGTVSVGIEPNCCNQGTGSVIFYVPTAASGTHTFAFNPFGHAGALYANATLEEWPGGTYDTLDKTSSVTNNTAASSTGGNTGTTATLSAAAELVYIGLAIGAGNGVANAGISSPGTFVGGAGTSLQVEQDTSSTVGSQTSYREVAANTAQQGSWTWTADGSMNETQQVLATFLKTTTARQPTLTLLGVGA
jgi:hypothetical protein